MNRNMLLSPSISNLVLHEIIVISPNLYRLLPLLPLPQVKRSMHPKKNTSLNYLDIHEWGILHPKNGD